MIRMSMCVFCKYYRYQDGKRVCAAFPTGIPREVFVGEIAHRDPYPGDHGIRYDPRDEEAALIVPKYKSE